MSPLVSVIVPTYNSEKYLERCLRSIQSQSYDNIEIIVVDNNSADRTKEIARKYTDEVYNRGPERSAQRNYGFWQSQGGFVLFIDSDMELKRNVVKECVNKAQHQNNLAFVIPERIPGRSWYSRARNLEKTIYDRNEKLCAARYYPREIFEQIGGWNENMNSGEDWDLDRRFRQYGGKVGFIREPILHHESDLGFIKSVKKKMEYARALRGKDVSNISNGELSPIYRMFVLFSKPWLILLQPLTFMYLLALKFSEFGFGFYVLKFQNDTV